MVVLLLLLQLLLPPPTCRVVILMGSASDKEWAYKIAGHCKKYGIPTECRVTSAHKGTSDTLEMVAKYEGDFITLS